MAVKYPDRPGLAATSLLSNAFVPNQEAILADFFANFTDVPEVDTAAGAGSHAGRGRPSRQSIQAQVAVLGHLLLIVKLHYLQGTGVNTVPAAITQLLIHQDDTVLSFGYGVYRTGIFTGRLAAVNTMAHGIPELQFTGYLPRVFSGNPYPSWPNGQIMFLLAGYLTGGAAHAILGVYDKSIFHSY